MMRGLALAALAFVGMAALFAALLILALYATRPTP